MESMMMIYSQEPTTEEENEETTCPNCISAKKQNPKRERPHSQVPKLPLYPNLPLSPPPPPPSTAFSSPLRRCTSDPVPLMPHLHSGGSADVATPENKTKLYRSLSTPEKDFIDQTPNSKRLRRMKEQMREISKWCDQVIAEGDEEVEDDEGEDRLVGAEVFDNEALKGDENKVCESAEEAVSVEKNGDCLIIHMKCPCSKGYQFLLSGNNCYYKIM